MFTWRQYRVALTWAVYPQTRSPSPSTLQYWTVGHRVPHYFLASTSRPPTTVSLMSRLESGWRPPAYLCRLGVVACAPFKTIGNAIGPLRGIGGGQHDRS